jgi:hypothetical protein
MEIATIQNAMLAIIGVRMQIVTKILAYIRILVIKYGITVIAAAHENENTYQSK